MKAPGLPFLTALSILAADQWTKWLVEAHLPPGLSQAVLPGFLDLVHVLNTGAAFGLLARAGAETRWVLLTLTLLALAAVALYFRALGSNDRVSRCALGLIFGGAAGNLLDRFFAGAVTDFVDLHLASHHWPAFNVADAAITTALGLLLLSAWKRSRLEKEAADAS